jgi:hypothetical protein
MQTRATYDDVGLILQLYELRREDKLRQAREWFSKSLNARNVEELQAQCPPGSEENTYFRMVTSYWEMVASFITSGVLNQELFFQSGGELLFTWEKVRDVAPAVREIYKNPIAYKNLETVANDYIAWMSSQAPEWYGVFSAFVRGAAR